jgi:hypothetical protein
VTCLVCSRISRKNAGDGGAYGTDYSALRAVPSLRLLVFWAKTKTHTHEVSAGRTGSNVMKGGEGKLPAVLSYSGGWVCVTERQECFCSNNYRQFCRTAVGGFV